MDTWRHPRLKGGHGAPGLGEPLSELDLEPQDLIACMGHPGEHVTGQQTQSELVRVVKDDGVVDRQIE
ncbi:hypothetical protein ACTMTF_24075 [Nonomuraea sp. ZG12]|uniref:hypothetical protein n=1 Tax=Nonomuraea sp. ZG12 TaxID=3452207 RepID=UPI003F887E8E